jgi:L-threonylcarbamoyladenylate synthase
MDGPVGSGRGRDKRSRGSFKNGGICAFPTETVYGVGAIRTQKKAVDRLYDIKERPRSKPFTYHIASMEMFRSFNCELSGSSSSLIERFWPGPVTFLFRQKGTGAVLGFRYPDNRIALELIEQAGDAVLAPSANLSGNASPVTAKDVLKDLDGKIDILLDGGPCLVGKDSTIIDLSQKEPVFVREGAVSFGEIRSMIGGNKYGT